MEQIEEDKRNATRKAAKAEAAALAEKQIEYSDAPEAVAEEMEMAA